MATPFNYQGNVPYSPRELRRQARAYGRAQRAAMRAQGYYGAMYRRRSVLGPLMLLLVGIVALLVETDRISAYAFWEWYVQWWPLLIIGMGLVLLAEYFVDRANPLGGRRRAGGVVFFVILIASLGVSADGMRGFGGFGHGWSDGLDIGNGGDLFSMMGEEHDNDATLSLPLRKDSLIDIQNARGDVTLAASTDDQVHVDARQIAHGSDADARRAFEETRPKLLPTGSGANLIVDGREGAVVNLTVSVPPGSSANVRTSHGDVTVAGMKRVDITEAHGDVKLDDISGDVHVQVDHGDVTANAVAGDVSIDGHAGDVSLSNVKGRATLNGEFFGETRLDQVGSVVHFHSSRTDLTVPKLKGELDLDSGDLNLSGPSGGMTLTTRSKDIEVTGLEGDARIENANGDINLSAVAPLGNLQATTGTGALTVTVPPEANFVVDAVAGKDEDVHTDFALTAQGSGGGEVLTGTVGRGGPKLTLRASHGEVSLRKGDVAAVAAPPVAPEAPRPPALPAGARHLRAGPTAPPEPTVQ